MEGTEEGLPLRPAHPPEDERDQSVKRYGKDNLLGTLSSAELIGKCIIVSEHKQS